MPERPRYEVLLNEEEESSAEDQNETPSTESQPANSSTTNEETTSSIAPVAPVAPDESPPPYIANPDNSINAEASPEASGESPPCYADVVKLPTYEELEDHQREEILRSYFDLPSPNEENSEDSVVHELSVKACISNYFSERTACQVFLQKSKTERYSCEYCTEVKLGSDLSFVLCFVVAFLLNWIGFLAGYCFGGSLAAQYGALSGFGLSLIKWAFLIKHSECCTDTFLEYPWIIWVFVIVGWLVFVRGALAYLQLKRLVPGRGSIRIWRW